MGVRNPLSAPSTPGVEVCYCHRLKAEPTLQHLAWSEARPGAPVGGAGGEVLPVPVLPQRHLPYANGRATLLE